jgi:hypothetical protein
MYSTDSGAKISEDGCRWQWLQPPPPAIQRYERLKDRKGDTWPLFIFKSLNKVRTPSCGYLFKWGKC